MAAYFSSAGPERRRARVGSVKVRVALPLVGAIMFSIARAAFASTAAQMAAAGKGVSAI